jgi:hypothetical protein
MKPSIVPFADNPYFATACGVAYGVGVTSGTHAQGLIDLVAAERAITPTKRAIVAVHLYGQMVSPTLLINLASTYDLLTFEDAARSHDRSQNL